MTGKLLPLCVLEGKFGVFPVFGIFLAGMGAVGCAMFCRTDVLGRGDGAGQWIVYAHRGICCAGEAGRQSARRGGNFLTGGGAMPLWLRRRGAGVMARIPPVGEARFKQGMSKRRRSATQWSAPRA